MKVSQSAKEKTRAKIIRTAVEVIIEKGFEKATLREIAKRSGVSNPTIYNYFPSKEKLLYAYVEQKHKETLALLEEIEDFHTYTLREQLQTLVETELELYLEDREFVMQIADLVFQSSGLRPGKLYATNALFVEIVEKMLDIAIEAGEIAEPPFGEYLPGLFWDYYILVVAYWIKDDSEMFENTTQFIDHSLGLIEAVLHSDILRRASDLGLFFFKTHIVNGIEKFAKRPAAFKSVKRKLGEVLRG